MTPGGGNAPQPAAGDTGGKPKQPSDNALAAMRQIPPGGAPILVEVGKGTLLRLPRPASTVFIANPDIADVQVKSPALIYLSGKAPGDTVIYAVDGDDNVMLHSPVRVDHDLSRLRQSMTSLMPGEHITRELGRVDRYCSAAAISRPRTGPKRRAPWRRALPPATTRTSRSSTTCRFGGDPERTGRICGCASPEVEPPAC